MHQSHPPTGQKLQKAGPNFRLAGIVFLAVMGVLAAWGIFSRYQASKSLRAETESQSIVTVATTHPKASGANGVLVLPGTLQAFVEAPIYARANGYIKSWTTDIGAVVKQGQVMAEIDSPEIDDQLHQAEADFAMAQANDVLAQSTSKRWQALLVTDSVTHQEVDEKVADAAAKAALLGSARANLQRLHALEGFKRVVAPFDGVVTARRTDIGALINAGSGSPGLELFRVADRSKLRVYVQVPQSASAVIATGLTAELHFAEHPGQSYPATVARTSDALDPAARTLLVELAIDNSKGVLLPGSYAEVHLHLAAAAGALRVPINALLFRAEGLQAAKVDASGKVSLVGLKTGRDLGTEIEVLDGLSVTDTIIVNPPDSVVSGQIVHLAAADGPQK